MLPGDRCAHPVGGEEFGGCSPTPTPSGALALAERARRAVDEGPWPLRTVTVSGGVAALGPAGAAGMVASADAALYRAAGGWNRVGLAAEAAGESGA